MRDGEEELTDLMCGGEKTTIVDRGEGQRTRHASQTHSKTKVLVGRFPTGSVEVEGSEEEVV